MIHSALVSWAARSVVFLSVRSAVALCPAVTIVDVGLASSYPVARIRNAYWPGSSRVRGKRYRPCASVATVVVIVEPAFLALTSTPSMVPSSTDVTCPVKAAAAGI